jgi:hypothetical protein
MDMDFRGPVRSYPQQQPAYHEAPPQQQPQQQPEPQYHHRKSGKGKAFFKFLLVLILIAAAAGGVWYYQDKKAKDEAAKQAQQISDLQDQLNSTRDSLAAANSKTQTNTTQTGPSEETVKKVQDAIKAGKYSDIKSLIAPHVVVTLSSSDGLGLRSPDQVVTDLKYIDGGTDPWSFEVSKEKLSAYQDGAYAAYFPSGALVGRSANGYVISVLFNDAGKITGIFMSNHERDIAL